MRIDRLIAKRLLRFVDTSGIALDALEEEIRGLPPSRRSQLMEFIRVHRRADALVEQAALGGSFDTAIPRPTDHSDLQGFCDRLSERQSEALRMAKVLPRSLAYGMRSHANDLELYRFVLSAILNGRAHPGSKLEDLASPSLDPIMIRRGNTAREIPPSEAGGCPCECDGDPMSGPDGYCLVCGGWIERAQATSTMTPDRIRGLAYRVSAYAFGGQTINWMIVELPRPHRQLGYLVWPCWWTNDSETREPCECSGAKFYISGHATENEVVQAMLRATIAAAEHEIRERFTFDGVPLYRPHQPLEALRDFTRATPPQVRQETRPASPSQPEA